MKQMPIASFSDEDIPFPKGRIKVLEGGQTVFVQKHLTHMEFRKFKPKNVREWEPRTGPDSYLCLGALQQFRDYEYACKTDTRLLRDLKCEADTKPEAILLEKATSKYMVAEFKMNACSFPLNHKKEGINVLVCWIDDVGTPAEREPTQTVASAYRKAFPSPIMRRSS